MPFVQWGDDEHACTAWRRGNGSRPRMCVECHRKRALRSKWKRLLDEYMLSWQRARRRQCRNANRMRAWYRDQLDRYWSQVEW